MTNIRSLTPIWGAERPKPGHSCKTLRSLPASLRADGEVGLEILTEISRRAMHKIYDTGRSHSTSHQRRWTSCRPLWAIRPQHTHNIESTSMIPFQMITKRSVPKIHEIHSEKSSNNHRCGIVININVHVKIWSVPLSIRSKYHPRSIISTSKFAQNCQSSCLHPHPLS